MKIGFAAGLAGILMAAAPAWAAGSAQTGAALAQRWCSACHLTSNNASGPDTAPPFATIAARHGQDREWLHAWLVRPHPPMPDLHLTRQEIDDITAYLESLPRS